MAKEFPLDAKGFHPFAELIGLNFSICENGYSQCNLSVSEKLINPHHVLHGGVMYSMADTGMGAALYSSLDQTELCATVEIKINYFKAVASGMITCKTKVLHRGKKIAVLESEIWHEENRVAKAFGTFSVFVVKENGL